MAWNNLIKIVIWSTIIQQCWGICKPIMEPEKGTDAAERYCNYGDYLVKGCDKCIICIHDKKDECKFNVHTLSKSSLSFKNTRSERTVNAARVGSPKIIPGKKNYRTVLKIRQFLITYVIKYYLHTKKKTVLFMKLNSFLLQI